MNWAIGRMQTGCSYKQGSLIWHSTIFLRISAELTKLYRRSGPLSLAKPYKIPTLRSFAVLSVLSLFSACQTFLISFNFKLLSLPLVHRLPNEPTSQSVLPTNSWHLDSHNLLHPTTPYFNTRYLWRKLQICTARIFQHILRRFISSNAPRADA